MTAREGRMACGGSWVGVVGWCGGGEGVCWSLDHPERHQTAIDQCAWTALRRRRRMGRGNWVVALWHGPSGPSEFGRVHKVVCYLVCTDVDLAVFSRLERCYLGAVRCLPSLSS